jgi:membrane associated rhomboid family serine protease
MARDSRPQLRIALPEIRNAATALALASIVLSVVWWLLLLSTGISLYLRPVTVFESLHLWQPVSWLVASNDAWGVLFTGLILWSIGGSIERRWGRSRFLRYVFGVTFVSGLLTLGLSLVITPLQAMMFTGGSTMSSMVWVTWGLLIWDEQTNLFGFPITGRTFALLGVILPVMIALFGWPLATMSLVPTFIAIALAFIIVRGGFSPSDFWLRFQSARLQRDLKKRSSRLSVISGGERNTPKDSDKYMH